MQTHDNWNSDMCSSWIFISNPHHAAHWVKNSKTRSQCTEFSDPGVIEENRNLKELEPLIFISYTHIIKTLWLTCTSKLQTILTILRITLSNVQITNCYPSWMLGFGKKIFVKAYFLMKHLVASPTASKKRKDTRSLWRRKKNY